MIITPPPKATVLGKDIDTKEQVILADKYAVRGTYIIGGTGTGKTNLTLSMILQKIRQGKGVGVIDPHADLIKDIIACMPEDRLKDVIYLNVSDEDHVFSLNPFTCDNPQSYAATQKVVDLVVHIFEKALDVSGDTPLILEYLQYCTYTLIANRGYTMADIPLLLTDKQFRQQLLTNVTEPDVLRFWEEHDKMRPQDQQNQSASILRRVRRFLQPITRNIVGQSFSTVDIFQAMEEEKIILVAFDPELESVTSLIGATIIALFLMAAYRRRHIKKDERKYFGLFCDEFQTYATADFPKILTELRKFTIATAIGHQARHQPGMTEGLRATTVQVGNLIILHVSGDDAESLANNFAPRPDPADVREREVQTPVSDVLGHLQKRGSHKDPRVNDFVHTYQLLGKAEYNFLFGKANRGVPFDQLIQTEEEKECLLQLVQTAFFQAVRETLPILPTYLKLLQSDRGMTYPAYYKGDTPSEQEVLQLVYFYLFIPNNRYILQHDRYAFPSEQTQVQREQQNLLATLLLHSGDPFGKEFKEASQALEKLARERFTAIRQEHTLSFRSQTVDNGTILSEVNHLVEVQKLLIEQFIQDLYQVLMTIRNDPIVSGSGSNEIVLGPPKPITSLLVGLDDYHAHVKIGTKRGRVEHTIRTSPPEDGVADDELEERIAWIVENNLKQGYLRDIHEVEEEIRGRQASFKLPQQARDDYSPVREY